MESSRVLNRSPVISGTPTGDVTEDVILTTGGLLSIADVDAGQSNFAPQPGTSGSFGTFTLTAGGAWTYTLNNSLPAIQQLNDGQSLTDSFTAFSSDGTASQKVTVTIHGTNDARVITTDITLHGETGTDHLIENDGNIKTDSNLTSTITGNIIGTGTLEITNNTTLVLGGSVGPGQTVQFDIGNGPAPVLVLQNPSGFQAKIKDFGGSDQIELAN